MACSLAFVSLPLWGDFCYSPHTRAHPQLCLAGSGGRFHFAEPRLLFMAEIVGFSVQIRLIGSLEGTVGNIGLCVWFCPCHSRLGETTKPQVLCGAFPFPLLPTGAGCWCELWEGCWLHSLV